MRVLSCAAAVCVLSVASVAADNPFVGTWKLDTAKSRGTPGMLSKEATVVFEAVGDQMKRTVTVIDPDGELVNSSSTIAWDGKEHKVEGWRGRPPVMVAVKSVNDRRVNVTVKNADDKIVLSFHYEVSKDGKTMTATYKGEDPKGRKFNKVEVFDKQ